MYLSLFTKESVVAKSSETMEDAISKNVKIRKSKNNLIIVIISCLFIVTSVFGQSGILPFLYLQKKDGDLFEILFSDGTISIFENQFFIDTPVDHYEYKYNEIDRFYFKDKSNLTLSDLIVSEGMLEPEFCSTIFDYTLNLPFETASVLIKATAVNPNAKITGDGIKELSNGTSRFSIKVTTEDEEIALTYTITTNYVTGIYNISNMDVKVYPNPTTGKFTVYIPNGLSICIFNMQGQLIEEGIICDDNSDFDISQYPAGVYLLKYYTSYLLVHL